VAITAGTYRTTVTGNKRLVLAKEAAGATTADVTFTNARVQFASGFPDSAADVNIGANRNATGNIDNSLDDIGAVHYLGMNAGSAYHVYAITNG
jgi:hypothetical protein